MSALLAALAAVSITAGFITWTIAVLLVGLVAGFAICWAVGPRRQESPTTTGRPRTELPPKREESPATASAAAGAEAGGADRSGQGAHRFVGTESTDPDQPLPDSLSADDGELEVDPKLGAIYAEEPETVDKLSRIKGIGPVIEAKLHDLGVYRFAQIATWDQTQIETFGERLDFPDRIEREDWVGQARLLAAES